MIKKKIIFVATMSALLFSANSFAKPPSTNLSSVFIAGNICYLDGDFNQTGTTRTPPFTTFDASNYAPGDFAWSVRAGYAWFPNKWLVAALVHYDQDDLSVSHVGRFTTNTTSIYNDYGLHLNLGFKLFNKIYLFAIAGPEEGQFKYESTGRHTITNRYSEPGYTVGVGVVHRVTKHFATHFSYEYSAFASNNNIGGDQSVYLRKGGFKTNTFSLGFDYYFNL